MIIAIDSLPLDTTPQIGYQTRGQTTDEPSCKGSRMTQILISAFVTTAAQADRARRIAAAKKTALREVDRANAARRGEVAPPRKHDGIDALYFAKELTDDLYRVAKLFQRDVEAISGVRGKNVLDITPSGCRDIALQATIDAGRRVDAIRACCTTELEKTALWGCAGLGRYVSDVAKSYFGYRNQRKDGEVLAALVGVLERVMK